MKIFTTSERSEHSSKIQTLNLSIEDDFESQISALESSETSLMAEHYAENDVVLQIAVKHWLGYGLYYPKIEAIDQNLLQAEFPKIILLNRDDPDIEFFSKFGLVVFDFEQYHKSIMELIYIATDAHHE